VSLTARVAPRAAAIDDAGRLWLLDTATGDLIWVADGQRHDRRAVARPGAGTLVLAGGAPVLVDAASRTASVIDPSTGAPRRTIELDLRPDDRIEVSGSASAARLYVVAARGVLEVCDLTGSACPTVVPLGGAGADLGAPVESGRRIFVPDYATGEVWIVDLDASRVVAQPKVLDPHTRFQLLNRDGVVFFNDPESEHAGVIRFDGGVRKIAKYRPGDRNPGAGADLPQKPPAPSKGPKKPDPKKPDPKPTSTPTPTPTPSTTTQPTPVIQIVASTSQLHVNEDVTFTVAVDTGAVPTLVHWDFGDGTADDGTPIGHRFLAEGSFLVSARANFPGGRTAVASQTFQVTIRPPVIATLTVTGVGGGATVTSQPPGISCPPTCRADFGVNASIQLTASVDPFTQDFRGWGGPCALAGTATTCTFTLPAGGATVPANIFPQPVLTLTVSGNGDVDDIAEFSCRQNTCQSIVQNGTKLTLNAHPDPGSTFAGWGGACAGAGTNLACTLTMNADKTVTAQFKVSGPLPAPVPVSPADGAKVGTSGVFEDFPTSVTWQAVAGAGSYEVESHQVHRGATFNQKTETIKGTSAMVDMSCHTALENPTTQWRVTAIAPDGTRGITSAWQNILCASSR
jgi:hypothetical protein